MLLPTFLHRRRRFVDQWYYDRTFLRRWRVELAGAVDQRRGIASRGIVVASGVAVRARSIAGGRVEAAAGITKETLAPPGPCCRGPCGVMLERLKTCHRRVGGSGPLVLLCNPP